ncbi:hypothetical protein PS9374_03712 [Planomonospora sphaerica]|jgi:hypothetical protein|uniref:Uncharacterized protein n=1 Tax=Planomonospora sphaerica TaxID=161355 RepID=A0A171DDE3_9ACTN|nr:hypothetical protein PS9374_03712 [Planomonospora sphaerica]
MTSQNIRKPGRMVIMPPPRLMRHDNVSYAPARVEMGEEA